MRILKNKAFRKWGAAQGLKDSVLVATVREIEAGLYDANLGASLFKKRVSLDGRGKRSGLRTIIAFKKEDRAIFLYGFAKNARVSITDKEERALKLLAKTYFELSLAELDTAIYSGELEEVIL